MGGLAGAAGVALLGIWILVSGHALTPVASVAWATPMVLLGALVGAASDRLRHAAEAERRLLVAEVRRREAAEINDAIIERLAADAPNHQPPRNARAMTTGALPGMCRSRTYQRANAWLGLPRGVTTWPRSGSCCWPPLQPRWRRPAIPAAGPPAADVDVQLARREPALLAAGQPDGLGLLPNRRRIDAVPP
ncbi:MAG: hypothetical protein GEV08_20495 [Acidimicrobiia bacterium]|nr:hypothetical protein [Acidimicrobiia bacterium]